jgi:hypothetical protein
VIASYRISVRLVAASVTREEVRAVAVVTPAVYQAYAERGLGPPLRPVAKPARVPLRFQAVRALARFSEVPGIAPEPARRLAAQGGTGTPLFGASELSAFLSDAREAPPDEPRRGRWWEFWPTMDGSYAMFPADDAEQTSLATTQWLLASESAYVRRIDVNPLNALARRMPRTPRVPPEPCVLLAKEAEPGAPYVGRCSNLNCGGGCSPHVVIQPDDGIYRLLGCDC